jgi:glycerol-3-phosphate acyltransferase PlsX
MKEEFTRTPMRKAGALLLKGASNDVKKRLDPDRYGGAPLLGLGGTVLKSHGSSNRMAIANAIRIAGVTVKNNLTEHIAKDIATANERIRAANPSTPA